MSGQALAEHFRAFAQACRTGGSPLYGQLCEHIAADPELLALAQGAQGAIPANLFLGVVRYFLLDDQQGHPLSACYPGTAIPPLLARTPYTYEFFRSFCLEHQDQIRAKLSTSLNQTNDVQRCTCLMPAFAIVAGRRPLALIEVGASAGLNLLWDRYGYRYNLDGEEELCGDRISPVQLSCCVQGRARPPIPAAFPEIPVRLGIDLHPLDVYQEEDRRWLHALLWPEQELRARLLDRALDLAQRVGPPPLIAGDATDCLAEVLEAVPSGMAICVYHTFTHITPEAHARLMQGIAISQREVFLVSLEWDGRNPPRLALTRFAGGSRQWARQLASCDSQGRQLEWHQEAVLWQE